MRRRRGRAGVPIRSMRSCAGCRPRFGDGGSCRAGRAGAGGMGSANRTAGAARRRPAFNGRVAAATVPMPRRPPCGTVRAAGRQPHPRMRVVGPGHRANTRMVWCRGRPAGPQAGVRANVSTGTGGWSPRPCATAPMRSAPHGRRSGPPSPTAGWPTATASSSTSMSQTVMSPKSRPADAPDRGLGKGSSTCPEPAGTTRGTISDTGNLPVVPDLPAFAAHTACDPGEAARQCARRTLGACRRLSGHMLPPAAHVVFPSRAGPVATPVISVHPPNTARMLQNHP